MATQPAWMKGPSFEADTPPAELPAAFAFSVSLTGLPDSPNPLTVSFQEVSGLEHTLETEDVAEGGENRFTHQLPTRAKARRLQLKRGLVPQDSPLASWCRQCLQWGLDKRLQLVDVQVKLLDAQLLPVMNWTCCNAYPVRWTINPFESQRNEVALEEIELAYQTLVSPP